MTIQQLIDRLSALGAEAKQAEATIGICDAEHGVAGGVFVPLAEIFDFEPGDDVVQLTAWADFDAWKSCKTWPPSREEREVHMTYLRGLQIADNLFGGGVDRVSHRGIAVRMRQDHAEGECEYIVEFSPLDAGRVCHTGNWGSFGDGSDEMPESHFTDEAKCRAFIAALAKTKAEGVWP